MPFNTIDFTLVLDAKSRASCRTAQVPKHYSSGSMPRSTLSADPQAQAAKLKLSGYDIPYGFCFKYLASMSCTGCQYQHLCPWCMQAHSLSSCRSKQYKHSKQCSSSLLSSAASISDGILILYDC